MVDTEGSRDRTQEDKAFVETLGIEVEDMRGDQKSKGHEGDPEWMEEEACILVLDIETAVLGMIPTHKGPK